LASAGFTGDPAVRRSASSLLLLRCLPFTILNWPRGSSAWEEPALSDSTPEIGSASEAYDARLTWESPCTPPLPQSGVRKEW
jgi:hypothetical protein